MHAFPFSGFDPSLPPSPASNIKHHNHVPTEVVNKMSPYRLPHVRDWYLHGCVSPWHPLPPHDEEIEDLWVKSPNMDQPILDYVGLHDLFMPLVHSGHEEVVNGVIRSNINMAILPDWLLNDDTALKILHLK